MYDGQLEAGDLGLHAVAHFLHALGLLGLLALRGLRGLVVLAQHGALLGNAGQDEIGFDVIVAPPLLLVLLHHAHAFFGLLGLLGDDLQLHVREYEGPVGPEDGVEDLFLHLGLGLAAQRVLALHQGGFHKAAVDVVRGIDPRRPEARDKQEGCQ